MVESGLIEETQMLIDRGYDWNLTALKAIGYKELRPYLQGEMSLEESLILLKRDSRHYAKRQMTWFRKDERIHWIEMNEEKQLNQLVKACMAEITSWLNKKEKASI
jgi:tRNA delta(2)-isopentenylpyrophosphate transferase